MDSSPPPLRPPPIWVADSLFGFSDTSSSGLSTPFGSLDSTRTETESDEEEDDGGVEDFLAELTRQVAGFTLQGEDDDDEEEDPSIVLQDLASEPREALKPSTRKKQSSPAPGRRRAEKSESAQKRGEHGAEQKKGKRRGSGGGGRSQALKSGSGMQAVFLGGSGYATGGASSSSGTGVFLPRGISNHRGPTESKRKSGCSTVLIPTRVLQVLQLHHSNKSQSNTRAAPPHHPSNATQNKTEHYSLTKREQISDVQTRPELDELEMPQLPQEWTY